MKKTLLFIFSILGTATFAQEHFSGISTSRRVGLLNAGINPAELANLKGKYEVNVFNFSANVANNKMTFGDLLGGNDNFEEMLFAGSEPLNMRADVEILGPAFAFKVEKWAFGISSSAKIKASLVDVNTTLGNAVTNGGIDNVSEVYDILASENQRVTGTSWGEIGLSIAREVYNTEEHRITAGATFNFLFPGTYANMGVSKFEGTIENNFGDVTLTDAHAELNFAYSGSLAGDFSESDNFTEFFAGGLNGFSTDIGVNYQWKAVDSTKYRINAGLAIRNLGSMTFKDDNNESTNYELDIQGNDALNLNQFEDAESIQDVEDVLLTSGYLNISPSEKDFRVKLPAILSGYADVNVYGNWYATAYIQQRMNEDNDNDQIAVQNIISLTPRFSTGFFEAYTPLANNEVSGFTAGIGFRLGGFFLGSGSALSAMIGDTNQADAYMGFRIGF
ncbi:hypothetical protein DVK85_09840 [Flavobacterium arcticum]|uniref:DUF5723 domain-containing protein n=1 Tax=Flavobacterium arcticum TaxID=1784713 RepID=A0A345HD59_9FLAO|nr:hypothetical protein [Flavobacterium arcticum]AXG74519.1 hypothetical protein DVK85_09840 [Flavobacterium arcticum]KAF2512360.1 hypothetical protein E0W72_03820 [Flavobacterium arcticum]